MKQKSMKVAALLGGVGMMGYMYLKKHPDKIQSMKDIGKEASRKMYNMLDND